MYVSKQEEMILSNTTNTLKTKYANDQEDMRIRKKANEDYKEFLSWLY